MNSLRPKTKSQNQNQNPLFLSPPHLSFFQLTLSFSHKTQKAVETFNTKTIKTLPYSKPHHYYYIKTIIIIIIFYFF